LIGKLADSIKNANITVNQKVYADSQIKLGTKTKTLPEDLGPSEFYLQDEEISQRDPSSSAPVTGSFTE
jgi:uncharacterized protein (DUF342 family)